MRRADIPLRVEEGGRFESGRSEARLKGLKRSQAKIWRGLTGALLMGGMVASFAATSQATPKKSAATKQSASNAGTSKKTKAAAPATQKSSKTSPVKKGGKKAVAAAPSKQVVRLKTAFVASAQLRPMAQQLAATRSVAAYNAVVGYARSHPGDGAAAAHLALGHAYALDRRYSDAVANYRLATVSGDAVSYT